MDVNEVRRRAGDLLAAGRSFGPAYEHEGTLVIPVAVVAGGGGGGVRGRPQEEADARADSGGGFGGLVYPVGAYVVREGRARFVPSVDVNLAVVCGLLLCRLLLKGSRRRRACRKAARWARRAAAQRSSPTASAARA